ncbi:MAG TPA: hypothetical protein ENN12_01350 [Epsilonproteobacteria bacterium]|nr:hypothetical protein [Campylobacterota bacterium]
MQDLDDTVEIKVLKVDTTVFSKDYKFLKGYDDIVKCNATGKVYKSNYKGTFVELVEVSNMGAMEKIEKGMTDFRNQLIKEGF